MSRTFGITFAAASVLIAGLIWYGFANTKGNHLDPIGTIGKVRVVPAGDDLTFMVIDFNIRNDSDRDMVLRSIHPVVTTANNEIAEGHTVPASDIPRVFANMTGLGEQYNPVLKPRDVIPAHQNVDRMVGVRFDAAATEIEKRKSVVLRLEDVTGVVLELKK